MFLVRKISLEKIVRAATADYVESDYNKNEMRSKQTIFSDFWKTLGLLILRLLLFPVIGGFYFLLCAWLIYILDLSPEKINFELVISYGISVLILLSGAIYVLLARWDWYVVRFESFYQKLYKKVTSNAHIIFTICVALVFSFILPVVDSLSLDFLLHPTDRQMHAFQFSLWMLYLSLLSLCAIFSKKGLILLAKERSDQKRKYTKSEIKIKKGSHVNWFVAFAVSSLAVVGWLQGLMGP